MRVKLNQPPHHYGIMFGHTIGDEAEWFPTLREVDKGCWSLDLYRVEWENFGEWLAIAFDTRGQSYSDADREAADMTNFAWLTSNMCLPEEIDEVPRVHVMWASSGTGWITTNIEDAKAAGVAVIGEVLCIVPPCGFVTTAGNATLTEPDDEDHDRNQCDTCRNYEHAIESLKVLSGDGGGLLDEEAYNERENDAWYEYAPDALGDELRDAALRTFAHRGEHGVKGWMDDDTAESIENHADEILPVINQDLHYNYGFSGEYHPPFLECIGTRVVKMLGAALFHPEMVAPFDYAAALKRKPLA